MALTLGVKVGDVVDIAGNWIAVLSVDSRRRATLICDDGRKVSITSKDLTEVAPAIWIGLGPHPATSKLQLLFDAPRHLAITRRLNQDQHS